MAGLPVSLALRTAMEVEPSAVWVFAAKPATTAAGNARSIRPLSTVNSWLCDDLHTDPQASAAVFLDTS